MGLVGILLAALGAALVWYWRLKMAREAARDVADVFGDVKAAARRYGFQNRRGGHPADLVEDPRVAATAMLAAMARQDGMLTRAQIEGLRRIAAEMFEIDAGAANEMVAYGRWLADQSLDPDDVARRLAPVLKAKAPPAAHEDLLRRLREVGEIEGGALSEVQEHMLQQLSERLGRRLPSRRL